MSSSTTMAAAKQGSTHTGPVPYATLPRPLLFAHRGASRHAPENTLEAFELGLRVGADVLELDVHMSRDGEVVVIHDATLERTTNGQGRVRDFTWQELSRLDAGYHFLTPSGEPLFRGRGLRLCRLAEVLDAFKDAAFNIEIKQREPAMVRATLDVLAAAGCDRVVLAAEHDVIMRAIEETRSGLALGLSRAQVLMVLKSAYLGRTLPAALHGRALQIPPRHGLLPIATSRVLAAAHAAAMQVHLWTIDDASIATAWLTRGVDGVMSNDPAALAGVVRDARRRA